MNLDVRTMYIAMGATCFIVALALVVFQAGRFRRDGTLLWTVGWAFQGVFYTLLGLRGFIWDFVSIVVANTMLIASFSLLYGAVRQFNGRPYRRGILLLPPAVTFVFFWVFSAYVDNVSYRVIFVSLLSILQISAAIWALFHEAPAHERRTYRLIGFAFFVYALIFFNRFLEGMTLPNGQISVLIVTTFRNVSVTAGFGVAILSGIGFVLMIRERTERLLRESERRYSDMLGNIHLISMMLDREARVTFCNDYLLRVTGWSREEVLGRNWFELFIPPGNDTLKGVFAALLDDLPPAWHHENEILTRSGERRLIRWNNSILRSPAGEVIGTASIGEDITESKQMEESLRRSEERFRSVLDNSLDCIYRLNMKTKCYEYISPSAEKIVGFSPEELMALDPETALAMIHPTDLPAMRAAIVRLEETGEAEAEYRQRTKYNDYLWISNHISLTRDGAGRPLYRNGNIRDITERKRMEEDLRESRDVLGDRVRERTMELALSNKELTIEIAERLKMEQALQESKDQLRMLASQILSAQENERKRIALEVHDVLGSSLSAIKFKAEEALLHLPKDRPSNISGPLQALIPLIQDTIEEARRIQSDLRPPLLDDLGILATLSWFCRRFETIYSGTWVEQAVAIPEEEVPDHLKIVLFRIIQEAMNNIGKHAQADSVFLGLRKVDGAIELLIKDNGSGFDPESLSSREISKKGMGLSSMRERVEFSGGSFSIESVQGKGTVILALWPV